MCWVFPHVCLLADGAVLRGRRFGNLVLAGARHGLPVSAEPSALADEAGAPPAPRG